MATPTNTFRSRAVQYSLRIMVVGCAVLAAGTVSVPVASAEPDVPPATASDAATLVTQLGRDLEILQEEQNQAQVVLDQHIAQATSSTVALGQVNAQLAEIDGRVRGVARSAFAGDRLGSFAAILTSGSPQEFLDRVNTLEFISGRDTVVLAEATQAHAEAQALSDAADAAVSASQAAVTDMAARRTDLETQITTYQGLYAQLSSSERDAVSGGSGGGQAPPGQIQAPPGQIIAPSEAARIAVETAYAQLGDPYVWAAAGPDAFDCSGLTMFSYAAAGVSLPHSSSMQSTMGVPVSRDELQPGDLIFTYDPVSHVGIYVGDGMMIHAYRSGTPVSLDPYDPWGAYNFARRIVG
ncbi:MAG: C40 family peptidase [Geodermatophilaceae bacterium]|nr:C40 family peptidase [Geodermatophilaceae bacterium]